MALAPTMPDFDRWREQLAVDAARTDGALAAALRACRNESEVRVLLHSQPLASNADVDVVLPHEQHLTPEQRAEARAYARSAEGRAAMRAQVEAAFMIEDPATGERVRADPNNPEHYAVLVERFPTLKYRGRTRIELERLENHGEGRFLPADLALTATGGVAEDPDRVLTEAEIMQAADRARDKAEALAQAALNDAHVITMAPPGTNFLVEMRVDEQPYAEGVRGVLPVPKDVLRNAIDVRADFTNSALTFANTYNTLVFTSKLLPLIEGGEETRCLPYHVVFRIYEALLARILTLDEWTMPHEALLAHQEQEARTLLKEVKKKKTKQRTKLRRYATLLLKGVARARDDMLEGRLTTPFREFLALKQDDAMYMHHTAIPLYSTDEVRAYHRAKLRMVDEVFVESLEALEKRVAADYDGKEEEKLTERDFLRELYILNHRSAVNRLRAYEAAFLMALGTARIPHAYAADLVTPLNIPEPGMAPEFVVQSLRMARASCAALQDAVFSYVQRVHPDCYEEASVPLSAGLLADTQTRIDDDGGEFDAAPSVAEMGAYYTGMTRQYKSVEILAVRRDVAKFILDRVSKHEVLFDETTNLEEDAAKLKADEDERVRSMRSYMDEALEYIICNGMVVEEDKEDEEEEGGEKRRNLLN